MSKYNTVVLLGPTATGKTSIAVSLASRFGWDIISADSRQVYKGLDLGSGKDIDEYKLSDGRKIPYHLIDVTTLHDEFNVFHFQQKFYSLFNEFSVSGKMPFVCGGTGMYVDSIVRDYDLTPVPENPELRKTLSEKSLEELDEMLLSYKPKLHNMSDLKLKDRVIKALEIQLFINSEEGKKFKSEHRRPEVNALVIGNTLPRAKLYENIRIRLHERLDCGMIEEVRSLHERDGYSWERLEKLGLEYRYVSLYLEGKMDKDEMIAELYHAICQFAKRQETWFRRMERKGVNIHWLPLEGSKDQRISDAEEYIRSSIGL